MLAMWDSVALWPRGLGLASFREFRFCLSFPPAGSVKRSGIPGSGGRTDWDWRRSCEFRFCAVFSFPVGAKLIMRARCGIPWCCGGADWALRPFCEFKFAFLRSAETVSYDLSLSSPASARPIILRSRCGIPWPRGRADWASRPFYEFVFRICFFSPVSANPIMCSRRGTQWLCGCADWASRPFCDFIFRAILFPYPAEK